ncbi:MAG: hypothetical protein EA398_01540 [Deltaproteobacteria bacterium]|nr:MAG: hypothetical protein EA398_01540 [Deltaproteobacteria bacterium]
MHQNSEQCRHHNGGTPNSPGALARDLHCSRHVTRHGHRIPVRIERTTPRPAPVARTAPLRKLARFRPHPVAAACALLCLALATPRPSTAQPPRFGLQADLGTAIAIGPGARSTIDLANPRTDGDRTVGNPFLADVYRAPALRLGVTLQLAELEIRYALERAQWSHARVLCTSEDTATRRGNGGVDDRGISWDCSGSGDRIEPSEARGAFLAHHLSGGTRIYAGELIGTFPWAAFATGLSLSRFDRDAQRRRLRAGVHASVGGGLDVPIDRNLTLVADIRYQGTLFAATARFTDNARRVSALDRGVLGATFDPQHTILLGIGFRSNLR